MSNTVGMLNGLGADGFPEGGQPNEVNNEALSAVNNVSVTFLLESSVDISSNICVSLFDTGSPCNLLRISSVPVQLTNKQLRPTGYH